MTVGKDFMSRFESSLPNSILEQAAEPVGRRLLAEYGALYVASGGAIPPDRIVFRDQTEVDGFQSRVDVGSICFDAITIELQRPAADKLAEAAEAAAGSGLSITPRGPDSGRRSYQDTVSLWHSRVEPALDHWLAHGRLDADTVARIRTLPPFEQVPVVLSLEEQGIYFAKDLSKTILYSVAPPGASQHLSMLAFDAAEFNDPQVRQILEDHFWFQTVPSDLPHFTFLGRPESELKDVGLKAVKSSERTFWVPDLERV
jgi:hypothetical protein